jgi:thiol-disulfide isomerase/thioredoxin
VLIWVLGEVGEKPVFAPDTEGVSVLKLSTRCCAQLGLLSAFVVLGLSLSALVIMPRRAKPVAVADMGTVAPDFRLTDITGQPTMLSQYRGQVVVLFFSSLTNPACSQYDERLARLADDYAGDARVKFLCLNVADKADPVLMRLDPLVAKRNFPTLLDDKAGVATRYSAGDTPMFIVIDPHGVVRYRGPFDNSADIAFASQSFCREAIRGVLDTSALRFAARR